MWRNLFFTVENIILGCLNGQIGQDDRLDKITKGDLDLMYTIRELCLLSGWEKGMRKAKTDAKMLLEQTEALKSSCTSRVFEVSTWKLLLVVLYGSEVEKYGDTYFQEVVVPKLCETLRGSVVCIRAKADRLIDLQAVFGRIYAMRDWNLLFDRGELICTEKIEGMEIMPLKYPVYIEDQLKNAMTVKNGEEIKQCYYRLYDYLRQETYSPEDMKECSHTILTWRCSTLIRSTRRSGQRSRRSAVCR